MTTHIDFEEIQKERVMLKRYKCHKEVHAEPMAAADYFSNSDRAVPEKIDANAEGYHVVYSMGLEDEYHSWSPRSAFEKGYSNVTTFKDRLELEQDELLVKALKLQDFTKDGLDETQKKLLKAQLGTMSSYLHLLGIRIQLLEGEK